MRKMLVGGLVITLCIAWFLCLVAWFSQQARPELDTQAIETIFEIPIARFRPEPQESAIFLTTVLTTPILCAAAYFALNKFYGSLKHWLGRRGIYRFLNLFWLSAAISLTFFGLKNAEFGYLQVSTLAMAPGLTLFFNMLVFLLILKTTMRSGHRSLTLKKILKWVYFSSGIAIILLIALETIFNDAEFYVPEIHFVAYFDSVVQVYLGKSLFVNFGSLYGAYALLLKPIFALIGLDVVKFTVVMGVFKAIVYLILLFLLWQVTKNKLIALMGFVSLFFYTRMRASLDIYDDPYFQYNPHRMFFPVLFIMMLWLYLNQKQPSGRKRFYWALMLMTPLSVLWNPDTGLVIVVTWLIFLIYQELLQIQSQKVDQVFFNSGKHLLAWLGSFLTGFVIFLLYTYFSSGSFPNLASAAEYIKPYYSYGFYMLPMPLLHPWNMVVLFYLIGLLIGIGHLVDSSGLLKTSPTKQDQAIVQLVFALSILGVGLFSYYVGRSHDLSLIVPAWPIFVLMVIFSDQLLQQLSPILRSRAFGWKKKLWVAFQKDLKAFTLAGMLYFMSASMLSVLVAMPAYLDVIAYRQKAIAQGQPDFIKQQVEFIQSTARPGDQILVLSDYAPELYLYTEYPRPLPIAGFGEIIFKKEWEIIHQFLSNPPQGAKIYWDTSFNELDPSSYDNLLIIDSTGSNKMILLEQKIR